MNIRDYETKLEQQKVRLRANLAEYEREDEKIKMSSRPSDLDLWRLSELVWAEWKWLGRLLGIREDQLALVELRHLEADGPRECAYQVLLLTTEGEIEVRTIVKALTQLRLLSCARKFLEWVGLAPMTLELN